MVSIISFSTLRMAEVIRIQAKRNEDNSWELTTPTFKGRQDDTVVITFRENININVSPTFWLDTWVSKNKKRTKDPNLWLLNETGRIVTPE
jgi:hypothetical protein